MFPGVESRNMDQVKQTPLQSAHESLGARFTEFGGWWMPVQYTSIMEEHRCVRAQAGLFDLSHMGEIAIRGPRALAVIQQLITNDAARLYDGKILYTPMCLPTGGVVDDILVYRLRHHEYLLIANAANVHKDWEWIQEVNAGQAELEDQSDATGLLAFQGPQSVAILSLLTSSDLDALYYYECVETEVAGIRVLLSRTGYTGEDGFEIYAARENLEALWHALYELLLVHDGQAIGLGARDTLRLEMGYALYGHEFSETTTPLEAGLRWTVAFDKHSFIGHEALRQQDASGVTRRLVGFEIVDRGIAREGYPVLLDGKSIGEVTSGSPSPSLGKNIGMAYISSELAHPGQSVEIEVHRKARRAVIIQTPFHPSSVRRRTHAI